MSDIIRRCALQEPMTAEEQQQADYCVSAMSLYAVINAAFALAEQQGLTLRLDLKRPAPRKKARRRP